MRIIKIFGTAVVLIAAAAMLYIEFGASENAVSPSTTQAIHHDSSITDTTATKQSTPPPSSKPRTRIPSRPLLEFDRNEDLQEFVAQNLDKAKSGDPEIERLIANAYEECKQLGSDPVAYATSRKAILKDYLSERQAAAFDQAIAAEGKRCGGLIAQATDTKNPGIWYRGAAANGDIASQVRLLANSSEMAPVASAMQSAIAASDGAAMAEVGNLLGSLSDDERSQLGGLSVDRMSGAAWQLAACEFGADCGPGGEQLRNICIRTGRCDFNSLEDAYRQLYSPIDLQHAMNLRDQIFTATNSGDAGSVISKK